MADCDLEEGFNSFDIKSLLEFLIGKPEKPSIHTKNAIDTLHYTILVKENLVPKLTVEKMAPIPHLEWVIRRKTYRQFGTLTELVIQKILSIVYLPKIIDFGIDNDPNVVARNNVSNEINLATIADDSLKAAYLILSDTSVSLRDSLPYILIICNSFYNPSEHLTLDEVLSCLSFFEGLTENLRLTFGPIGSIYLNKRLMFDINPDLTLIGRPDMVCDDVVIDIKTTTNFEVMKENTFLQILTYAALMRANGLNCNKVGILLPIQARFILFDISNWNNETVKKYLQFVNRNVTGTLRGYQILRTYGIGSHFQKESTLVNSLQSYYQGKSAKIPGQIYLRSPSGKGSVKEADIYHSSEIIRGNNLSVYVHAPTAFNLSTISSTNRELIRHDLTVANKIGAKGVVFHVGKACKLPVPDALNNMGNLIRESLIYATPDCPFLLETPAGQGTELLTTPDDLLGFYMCFTEEERTRFKLVVDTCHVDATGFKPSIYLQYVLSQIPGSVKLIHFNDSKNPCGSRVDRHAFIGQGYIGTEELEQVAIVATKEKIPMVVE